MDRGAGALDASHSSAPYVSLFIDQVGAIEDEINTLEQSTGFITSYQIESLFQKVYTELVGEATEKHYPSVQEIAAIFSYSGAARLTKTQMSGQSRQWSWHFDALRHAVTVLKRVEESRMSAANDEWVDSNVTRKLDKLRIFVVRHKGVSQDDPLVAEIAGQISAYHDQLIANLDYLVRQLSSLTQLENSRRTCEQAVQELKSNAEILSKDEEGLKRYLATVAVQAELTAQNREDIMNALRKTTTRNGLLQSEIDALKLQLGGHIGSSLGDFGPLATSLQEQAQTLRQIQEAAEDVEQRFQSSRDKACDQYRILQSALIDLNSLKKLHLQDHLKSFEEISSALQPSADFNSLFTGNPNGIRGLLPHIEDNEPMLELEAEKRQLTQMLETERGKSDALESSVSTLATRYQELNRKRIESTAKRNAEIRLRSQTHAAKLSQSRHKEKELNEKNNKMESSLQNIKNEQKNLERNFFETLQPAAIALQAEFDELNQKESEFQTNIMTLQHAANNVTSLMESISRAQAEWRRPTNDEASSALEIDFDADVEEQLMTLFSEKIKASHVVEASVPDMDAENSELSSDL